MSFIEQIWIVDDDSSIRWVMEKALAAADISNTSFESPLDLLEALKTDSPDVIVSDIRMPEMDGMEATVEIRKFKSKDELPIVALTANVLQEEVIHYKKIGMNDHIGKPFERSMGIFAQGDIQAAG